MTKTLTRTTINTIIERMLERLTEDERLDLTFDAFEEKYIYEDDLSIYKPVKPVLECFANKLDVNVDDLTIFLNPDNIFDYDEDLEKLY